MLRSPGGAGSVPARRRNRCASDHDIWCRSAGSITLPGGGRHGRGLGRRAHEVSWCPPSR